MKNRKPVVVAAGFFRQRHETLFKELQNRFDVRLFSPAGHWPEAQPFQITEHTIEQSEIERAGKFYWDFITQIEDGLDGPWRADRDVAAWRIVQSLLVQWVKCRYIQESFIRFHQQTPLSAVVVVNDHLAPHRTLVAAAKTLGVPSFYIDHGFPLAGFLAASLKSKDAAVTPAADVVCVDNELHKQVLLGYYDSAELAPAMCVTGTPLDGLQVAPAASNTMKKKSCTNLIFCPSWYEANSIQEVMFGNLIEHRAFEHFCRLAARLQNNLPQQPFNIVVKLHPTLTKNIGANTAPYYVKSANRHNLKITVDDGPIARWLANADLLVCSRNSSAAWEAFMNSTPVITYLSDFYKRVLQEEAWPRPTLLASWGVQHYSDGGDWLETALQFLEKKRSGEFDRLCEQHRAKLAIIDVQTAAVNVANVIAARVSPPETDFSKTRPAKLKILEVVHNFPPHSFSGTELYTLNLAKEFQKLGHDVTVLYPVMRSDKPLNFFEPRQYRGVKVVEFNVFDAGRPGRSDFLNPVYDQPFRYFLAANDFDVVQFQHIYGLSANWIAIAKELGARIFLKVDDMFFYCAKIHLINRAGGPCSGPESLDKCFDCTFTGHQNQPGRVAEGYKHLAFRRAYLQKVFKLPDFVQAASKFLKESLLRAGFFNSNFQVITTGIEPFEPLPKKKSDDPINVGFLGYLHLRKGILDFLNAIEIFQKREPNSNLKFVIYGHHLNDDLYRHVLSKASRLQNIVYCGSFEPTDRPAIFSQIDLLVMPSIGENYPFLLREALYAGVPVAASKIAGIPEIVKPGKNGFLFPPGDAHALAALFGKISDDPAILQRLKPDRRKIKLVAQEAKELEAVFLKFHYSKHAAPAAPVKPPHQFAERNRVDVLFEQGRNLIKEGKLLDGMEVLSRLLDLKPNHSPTLQLMGDVYHRLGKETEARQMWQLALATAA